MAMLKAIALAFCFGRMLVAAQDYTFIKCSLSPRDRVSHNFPHARMGSNTQFSGNWCGYVAQTNLSNPAPYSVTKVSGSWIVPSVLPSAVNTACAIWVGIDGSGSPSVEQIGTSHDVTNGVANHYAWFEMFPQGSHNLIGFPVEVGDSISADVWYVPVSLVPGPGSLFVLKITNHTKRMYTVVPSILTVDVKRLSAEWIVEAPFVNGTEPLTHFSNISLFECIAEVNGVPGAINNPSWQNDSMNMVSPSGAPKSVASPLSVDGKSFSVIWDSN